MNLPNIPWKKISGFFKGHITPFRLLYWGTAIATFRHSSLGFATVEGSLFWGALSADTWKARWYGKGKWYKKQLSKARRRAWKSGKPATRWESECNWKGM